MSYIRFIQLDNYEREIPEVYDIGLGVTQIGNYHFNSNTNTATVHDYLEINKYVGTQYIGFFDKKTVDLKNAAEYSWHIFASGSYVSFMFDISNVINCNTLEIPDVELESRITPIAGKLQYFHPPLFTNEKDETTNKYLKNPPGQRIHMRNYGEVDFVGNCHVWGVVKNKVNKFQVKPKLREVIIRRIMNIHSYDENKLINDNNYYINAIIELLSKENNLQLIPYNFSEVRTQIERKNAEKNKEQTIRIRDAELIKIRSDIINFLVEKRCNLSRINENTDSNIETCINSSSLSNPDKETLIKLANNYVDTQSTNIPNYIRLILNLKSPQPLPPPKNAVAQVNANARLHANVTGRKREASFEKKEDSSEKREASSKKMPVSDDNAFNVQTLKHSLVSTDKRLIKGNKVKIIKPDIPETYKGVWTVLKSTGNIIAIQNDKNIIIEVHKNYLEKETSNSNTNKKLKITTTSRGGKKNKKTHNTKITQKNYTKNRK